MIYKLDGEDPTTPDKEETPQEDKPKEEEKPEEEKPEEEKVDDGELPSQVPTPAV